MKRTIKFSDCKSEVPIVEFFLNDGNNGFAIVDSGSETTIFDSWFVKENRKMFTIHKPENKMNLIGMNNNLEVPIIKADTKMIMSDIGLPISDAMVLNISHLTEHIKKEYNEDIRVSAIFGSDFLNKIKAEINYKNKEMTINYDISGQ